MSTIVSFVFGSSAFPPIRRKHELLLPSLKLLSMMCAALSLDMFMIHPILPGVFISFSLSSFQNSHFFSAPNLILLSEKNPRASHTRQSHCQVRSLESYCGPLVCWGPLTLIRPHPIQLYFSLPQLFQLSAHVFSWLFPHIAHFRRDSFAAAAPVVVAPVATGPSSRVVSEPPSPHPAKAVAVSFGKCCASLLPPAPNHTHIDTRL